MLSLRSCRFNIAARTSSPTVNVLIYISGDVCWICQTYICPLFLPTDPKKIQDRSQGKSLSVSCDNDIYTGHVSRIVNRKAKLRMGSRVWEVKLHLLLETRCARVRFHSVAVRIRNGATAWCRREVANS